MSSPSERQIAESYLDEVRALARRYSTVFRPWPDLEVWIDEFSTVGLQVSFDAVDRWTRQVEYFTGPLETEGMATEFVDGFTYRAGQLGKTIGRGIKRGDLSPPEVGTFALVEVLLDQYVALNGLLLQGEGRSMLTARKLRNNPVSYIGPDEFVEIQNEYGRDRLPPFYLTTLAFHGPRKLREAAREFVERSEHVAANSSMPLDVARRLAVGYPKQFQETWDEFERLHADLGHQLPEVAPGLLWIAISQDLKICRTGDLDSVRAIVEKGRDKRLTRQADYKTTVRQQKLDRAGEKFADLFEPRSGSCNVDIDAFLSEVRQYFNDPIVVSSRTNRPIEFKTNRSKIVASCDELLERLIANDQIAKFDQLSPNAQAAMREGFAPVVEQLIYTTGRMAVEDRGTSLLAFDAPSRTAICTVIANEIVDLHLALERIQNYAPGSEHRLRHSQVLGTSAEDVEGLAAEFGTVLPPLVISRSVDKYAGRARPELVAIRDESKVLAEQEGVSQSDAALILNQYKVDGHQAVRVFAFTLRGLTDGDLGAAAGHRKAAFEAVRAWSKAAGTEIGVV